MGRNGSAGDQSPGSPGGGAVITADGSYLDSHIPPTAAHISRPKVTKQLPPQAVRWNTDSLALRLGVDVASALGAASIICPVITMIDRAVIEKASKGLPLSQSLASSLKHLATRPHRFISSAPFLLIYMVYSSTYIAANFIDTISSTANNHSFSSVSAGFAKFVATSTVNMSLGIFKDAQFARIFGAHDRKQGSSSRGGADPASQRPTMPKRSIALFGARDSITIFASFNVPTLVAPHVPDFLASTPAAKMSLAQFTAPAAVQIISTPLHLLGLDLYNRQPAGGIPAADRWARVRRDWIPSFFARIGRIIPAYGVGGVVNTNLRMGMMTSLEQGYDEPL
ncbi:hypothetical protein AJ80_05686 [Polytolypa hystricis UAMH7299]|uniref:Sequence orphan n=1 Tax=Polytolypa hystricis (strain UAMH7299) TaxID=1447883 RepID=A0A2B7Y1Z0_POLH7|nr:hypothetical protein AJ80_05686 [Polytolypa hystricis UAMH7299]